MKNWSKQQKCLQIYIMIAATKHIVTVAKGGHSIAPNTQAPVRNEKTRKVANANVRIG